MNKSKDLKVNDVILITLGGTRIVAKVIKVCVDGDVDDVRVQDLWLSEQNALEEWTYTGGVFEVVDSLKNATIKYPELFI